MFESLLREGLESLCHECLGSMEQVCSGRLWDLESNPMQEPALGLHPGGSSVVRMGNGQLGVQWEPRARAQKARL